ncbi:MAG: FkbM family methyltransferase [Pseudomonadota bacterium]
MPYSPLKDPSDPGEQAFRRGFDWSCRKHGLNYEHVIEAVYRRASRQWAPGFAIDGGAHKGLHTLPLASLEPIQHVVAVEPGEAALEVLRKRIQTNSAGPKIDVVVAALQDDPERATVTFQVSTTHPGRSGINPILQQNKDTLYGAPVEVPATTLDTLAEGRPGGCRFVKLDLEGGEYNALRGGSRMLARDKPLMVFENGRHAPEIGGYSREDFLRLLDGVGMVFVTAFGDIGTPENMRDHWYAWACGKADARRIRGMVRAEAGKVFKKRRQDMAAEGVPL